MHTHKSNVSSLYLRSPPNHARTHTPARTHEHKPQKSCVLPQGRPPAAATERPQIKLRPAPGVVTMGRLGQLTS